MKYEIKQLNDTDAVVISDEKIKENNYYISWETDYATEPKERFVLYVLVTKTNGKNPKKVIATISPFKLEGLPMLELPNKTPIIDTFWLEKLCYYDRRNPDFEIKEEFGYDKEEVEATGNFAKKDCVCDNCFYGRTKMAEKYIFELPNQEEDVEKLADLSNGYLIYAKDTKAPIFKEGFIAGYNAAQKQFSESDMINAFIEGSNSGVQFQSICEDYYGEAELYAKSDLEYFKQSLQKKQFPTSVELTEDLQQRKTLNK